MVKWGIKLCLLIWAYVPLYADLRLEIDRSKISVSETLSLKLISDQIEALQADLSAIEKDFNIISRSQSQSIQIINGQQNTRAELVMELLPKAVGNFVLGPVHYGALVSNEVRVEVGATPIIKPGSMGAEQGLFLRVGLNSVPVYVGQTAILSLKLFIEQAGVRGGIQPPQFSWADLQPLGQDLSYRTQIDGKSYQVIERRYYLTAKLAGAQTIPAITFSGTIPLGNADPFDPFSRMTNRSVVIQSKPITVEVRDKPAGNSWWLPVQNLSLKDYWKDFDAQSLKVGGAMTRVLMMDIQGALPEQIPEFLVPQSEDFDIFAEKPEKKLLDPETMHSSFQQSWVIVPKRPGKVSLPALVIPWFDVGQGQMKEAKLEAKSFDIQDSVKELSSDTKNFTHSRSADSFSSEKGYLIRFMARISTILPWFLLLILFGFMWLPKLWRQVSRLRIRRGYVLLIKMAVCRRDALGLKQALMDYAHTQGLNVRNLTDIQNAESLPLSYRRWAEALSRHLYAGQEMDWQE